jgi:sugar lactone lactonase YvrE
VTSRFRSFLAATLAIALGFAVTEARVTVSAAVPVPQLRIVGPAGEDPPVVNERRNIRLRVVDETGDVSVTVWKTGSPTVAKVTKKGVLKGRLYGFATITAVTGRGEVTTTAVVARVTRRHGSMGDGDTKSDSAGRIYLTSPDEQVIYRSDGVRDEIFAGTKGEAGYQDGTGQNARFHYPTGLGVDVSTNGGLYVADTDNHCIRKVGFDGRTSIATGVPQFPGRIDADVVPAAEAVFDSPQGVAAFGQSLFVADTRNHALYYLNGRGDAVSLLAGQPGVLGFRNGLFREASFKLPSGIAINTEGNLLAVADTGNNAVRLVRIEPGGSPYLGRVSTAGVASKAGRGAPGTGIVFSAPTSVAFDSAQNVCVVDSLGASVITRAADGTEAQVLLAQPGSLGRPASIVVSGTRAIIADADASTPGVAIAVVEVGAPRITAVTPSQLQQDVTNNEVVINGENFPPEARVVVDGQLQDKVRVESATRIVVTIGGNVQRGSRLISVLTRGGVAQKEIDYVAPSLDDICRGCLTTFAGTVAPPLGDGGLATDLKTAIGFASDVSFDRSGNVFITSPSTHRVRRVDSQSKTITTLVGTGRPVPGTDGVPGVAFGLSSPHSSAVGPDGSVYVSDTGFHRVVRIDPITTEVETILGTVKVPGEGTDGAIAGPGFLLNSPTALAVDRFGNIFVADQDNFRLLRIDAESKRVHVVAGGGPVEGVPPDGSPVTSTKFVVLSLDIDDSGNLFLAASPIGAYAPRVIRVLSDGRTQTVHPTGSVVACGADGDLFIGNDTGLGFFVEHTGVDGSDRRTIAGGGPIGRIGDDGPATNASLGVADIAVDGAGNVLIADFGNQRIRRVDGESGIITTTAGRHWIELAGDGGFRTSANIRAMKDLAWIDGVGLVVADKAARGVRVVNGETGIITTPIGGAFPMLLVDPIDGDPAMGAEVSPFAVAIDRRSRVLFSELSRTLGSSILWAVGSDVRLALLAGGGLELADDVPINRANLGLVACLTNAPNGDVLFVDSRSRRIRYIDHDSMTVRTLAGRIHEGSDYSGEGGLAVDATLVAPEAIALAPNGDLFVADDARILKVDSSGVITTIAGGPDHGVAIDGEQISSTRFGRIADLAIDSSGDLYVADSENNIVIRFDFVNNVTVRVVGNGENQNGEDGSVAAGSPIESPVALAFDDEGNLYVGSTVAAVVRVIKGAAGLNSGALRRK